LTTKENVMTIYLGTFSQEPNSIIEYYALWNRVPPPIAIAVIAVGFGTEARVISQGSQQARFHDPDNLYQRNVWVIQTIGGGEFDVYGIE
jgi:hypothetical protein